MDAMSLDERLPSRRELILESLGLGIIPTMLLAPAVALGDAVSFREGVIRQEIDFKASPERVYGALTNDREFRAFSGADAKIQGERGGAFTLFDGLIIGCNVELTPDRQIVQAWRARQWAPGVYSIVRFDLTAHESGTRVVMEQIGFPLDSGAALEAGWTRFYWHPLERYLQA
jgi:activator of HSP90 ATPase